MGYWYGRMDGKFSETDQTLACDCAIAIGPQARDTVRSRSSCMYSHPPPTVAAQHAEAEDGPGNRLEGPRWPVIAAVPREFNALVGG